MEAANSVSSPINIAGNSNVCSTPECVQAANEIMSDMDMNADPCSDFYQYTCGSWLKTVPIPDDKSSIGNLETADDINIQIMRQILEGTYDKAYTSLLSSDQGFHTADQISEDKKNFQQIQDYYNVCMDSKYIDSLGPTPIYSDISNIENILFPVKDESAMFSKDATDQLSKTLAYYLHIGISTMTTIFVDADDRKPGENALLFDQVNLGLPSKEYYENAQILEKYSAGLTDILTKVLGANAPNGTLEDNKIRTEESEKYNLGLWSTDKISNAVKRYIDFETKLASISLKNEDVQDPVKSYNPEKLTNFQAQNPFVDWTNVINSLLPPGSLTAPDTVVIRTPDYYQRLNALLSSGQVSLLTIQEYFVIQFVTSRIYALDSTSRAAYRKMSGDISSGTSKEQARWRLCVGYTSNTFPNSLGRYYVLKKFGAEAERKKAESFLTTIHKAWLDRLPNIAWLDDKTRAKAIEKVNLIKHKVGYSIKSPDLRQPKSISEYDDGMFVNKTSFYDTESVLSIWYSQKMWKKTGQPIDKNEWLMSPQTVNAYYTSNGNEIVIPAGILQNPFYSIAYPQYLNYGGIGMIIGHELSHAFDNSGRKFDGYGNLVDWWTNATSEKFDEKTKCFIDQYSKFSVTGPNNKTSNVNGKLTLGENLADHGGLSASYSAYHQHLKATHKQDELLPGLENMSPDALFFVNFGRVWCRKQRDKLAFQMILTDVHSPAMDRVNGVVQNNEDFAKVFKCPAGSPMNPIKKCDMW